MSEIDPKLIAAVMNDPAVQKAEQQVFSAIKVYQADATAIENDSGLSLAQQKEKLLNSQGVQAADYMEAKARSVLSAALEKQGVHGVDMSDDSAMSNAIRGAFKDQLHQDVTKSGIEVTAADRQNVQDILKEKTAMARGVVADVLGDERIKKFEEQAISVSKAIEGNGDQRLGNMTQLSFLEAEARGAVADVMQKHGITFIPDAETGPSRDVTVALQEQSRKIVSSGELTSKDKENINAVNADLAVYSAAHQNDYATPVNAKPARDPQIAGPAK